MMTRKSGMRFSTGSAQAMIRSRARDMPNPESQSPRFRGGKF